MKESEENSIPHSFNAFSLIMEASADDKSLSIMFIFKDRDCALTIMLSPSFSFSRREREEMKGEYTPSPASRSVSAPD